MFVFLLLCIAFATATPITSVNSDLGLPDEVSKDVKDSLGSSQIIDLYTALIIQQASFPRISRLEDVPVHQEAVKATARTWRSDVRPALFNVNDAILAFSYQFDAFYDPIVEYANRIDTDEGKETFIVLLEELVSEIRQQQTATINAGRKLRTFFERMAQHKGIIQNDKTRISQVIGGDESRIQDIQRRIDSIQAEIREEEDNLKTGKIVFWTTFFIPGINLIGVSMMNGASDAMNQKLQEKQQLTIEMNGINSRIALADAMSRDVVNLAHYIEAVVNATESLQRAWGQLANDYVNVMQAVNIDVNTMASKMKARLLKVLVKPKLAAAKTQWQSLAASAAEIKRSHLIPPRSS